MVVASTDWKVFEAVDAGEPLVILMTTRPTTITRTTPTAIQVKRPAGRPPFAGVWVFLLAGDFATMLLFAVYLYKLSGHISNRRFRYETLR